MRRIMFAWSGMRILRLLIGVAALVQGIVQKETLLLIAGIWILIGAIFNVGCSGGGVCSVPISPSKLKKEIEHEEVNDSNISAG